MDESTCKNSNDTTPDPPDPVPLTTHQLAKLLLAQPDVLVVIGYQGDCFYGVYALKPITIFECSTSKFTYFEAKDEAYQQKYHPNEKTFPAIEI